MLPRPVPIFDSTSTSMSLVISSESLPLIIANDPSQVYSRRLCSPAPPPGSSLDSGILPTHLASDIAPKIVHPRYHPCVHCPPSRYLFSASTNHQISKYVSYQGLSTSYQSFISQVDSVSIPRSVYEALQNPKWVAEMKAELDTLQGNQM